MMVVVEGKDDREATLITGRYKTDYIRLCCSTSAIMAGRGMFVRLVLF
jgi:hypothetical protein